jgi:hypothetical protein
MHADGNHSKRSVQILALAGQADSAVPEWLHLIAWLRQYGGQQNVHTSGDR